MWPERVLGWTPRVQLVFKNSWNKTGIWKCFFHWENWLLSRNNSKNQWCLRLQVGSATPFFPSFFSELIIFLPETKFISFRCLVNIKLRQQQLVNCKIYENKNGLIFDEASIKRDLIVHILFMNYGEQFILFLPFRTAPKSCGAEPSLRARGAGISSSLGLFFSVADHRQGMRSPVLPGRGLHLPCRPALSNPDVGSGLCVSTAMTKPALLYSSSFHIAGSFLSSTCRLCAWAAHIMDSQKQFSLQLPQSFFFSFSFFFPCIPFMQIGFW